MKIKSLFSIFLLSSTSIVTLIFQSSCADNNSLKYYQYMADRTFSLQLEVDTCTLNDGNFVVSNTNILGAGGTAWILDNVKNGGQYEYYLGTNFHVSSIMFPGPGVVSSGTVLDGGSILPVYMTVTEKYFTNLRAKVWISSKISDQTCSYEEINSLHEITLNSCWNADFGALQDSSHKPDEGQDYFTDFSILGVDFGSFDDTASDQFIKNKLDNLNTNYVSKNIPITKFKLNPYTNFTSEFYTLGYPDSWTNDSFMIDYSRGKPTNYLQIPNINFPDLIFDLNRLDGDEVIPFGAYYQMEPKFHSWHGQSGSMIIDKDFNLVALIDMGTPNIRNECISYDVILINNIDYGEGYNWNYNFVSDFLTNIGITGNNQDKYFA